MGLDCRHGLLNPGDTRENGGLSFFHVSLGNAGVCYVLCLWRREMEEIIGCFDLACGSGGVTKENGTQWKVTLNFKRLNFKKNEKMAKNPWGIRTGNYKKDIKIVLSTLLQIWFTIVLICTFLEYFCLPLVTWRLYTIKHSIWGNMNKNWIDEKQEGTCLLFPLHWKLLGLYSKADSHVMDYKYTQ